MKVRTEMYYRRENEEILSTIQNFCLYHDLFHGLAIINILDTGVFFGGPWDVFSTDFIQSKFLPARRAYGPERGGGSLVRAIADSENKKFGTSYQSENIAIMPGAWARLAYSTQTIYNGGII